MAHSELIMLRILSARFSFLRLPMVSKFGQLLVIASLLTLASCINVEDFGALLG